MCFLGKHTCKVAAFGRNKDEKGFWEDTEGGAVWARIGKGRMEEGVCSIGLSKSEGGWTWMV